MRNLLQLTQSAVRVCREHGAAELLRRARGQLRRYRQGLAYQRWLRECEGPAIAAARQASVGGNGPERLLTISVILPVYNVDPRWLRAAIDSVLAQSYPHLELCIADDASPRPELAPLLRDYARRDPRVKLTLRATNGHIAAASNSALELASGEFVALLDHDDLLPPYALELVARELARCPQADLIFSDEDKLDPRGRRFEPSFKSELNYDLLLSQNQINHLGVYRTALVRAVGGFRLGLEGSQDYDLALRVLEQTTAERVRHIPHILYHWRSIPGSTALSGDEKPYAHAAARRAVHEHLQRRGVAARVLPAYGDWHRVQYALPAEPPLVSLIVRASERREQLAPLLADLRGNTDYRPLEVVLVEPGPAAELWPRLEEVSGPELALLRLVAERAESAAAQNNRAARAAHGRVLVFVDPGLHALTPQWLRELVSQALRPEIGAVGGRLLCADGRVEQAGMILGLGGELAGRSQHGGGRDEGGYLGQAQLLRQCSAVSGACLALRAEVFAAVGGFDAAHLPTDYSDTDLCLRLRERGLAVLYTPYAELMYDRRGSGAAPPPASPAADYMRRRWGESLLRDPFYSPNRALECDPSRWLSRAESVFCAAVSTQMRSSTLPNKNS